MKFTAKLLPFLRINLLLIPTILSSIIFGYFTPFITSYICAFVHELSHVITAKALKIKISHIELQPFGICACLNSDIISNTVSEIIISLAGPLCSLTLALFGHFLAIGSEYFVLCNTAMAIFNLLPVLPLDGGRIMRALLCTRLGAVSAYNTAVKISHIPLILLVLIGVYSLFTAQFNFSLILIGTFLLSNIFAEQHNVSRRAVRELLGYREKLRPDDLSRATVLCADGSAPARKILRHLSYSRYHIIHVTDKNMNITKTLTEGQLLDAVSKKGIYVTLNDVN